MTTFHLSQLFADPNDADTWLAPLSAAMTMFEINTASRMKMFLAQVAHESDGFTVLVENLNYSAARLMATFPRKFSTEQALAYAHSPDRIANHVYADLNGNGDEETGDGWRFRGRGLIQLTALGNYQRCGRALGVDLVAAPELLETPEFAAKSAAWFFSANGCNELADKNDFEGITRRINGGLNGQADRLAWLAKVERSYA